MKLDRQKILANHITIPWSGCWIYMGKLHNGYGDIAGKTLSRISYETFVGPIPNGLHVLHRCNIKCCINPTHLYLGTPRQNSFDVFNQPLPKANAKLTIKDVERVLQLREQGKTHQEIADMSNIARSQVGNICRGQCWKHVGNSAGSTSLPLPSTTSPKRTHHE